MKIQSLAVMFIIIILPISLVLSTYVQNRVETISMQSQYDSKLKSATYDALKAYQLNSFNSASQDITNSKMRDIKASVNSFFNSLSTNFSTVGYTKETLQNYVPAVVYTMYDGYYIYSPYTNTWDDEKKEKNNEDADISYKDGEKIYGLKPYVYYSCRYKNTSSDIIITYSLDNYISIQGTITKDGQKTPVSKYGYLLSNVKENNGKITYNDIEIDGENILSENVCVDGEINNYPCIKINGVKYYKNFSGEIFSMLNGKKQVVQKDQNGNYTVTYNNKTVDLQVMFANNNNDNGKQYYSEAIKMKEFINNYLSDLKVTDAVDLNGNSFGSDSNFTDLRNSNNGYLFDFTHNGGIEAKDSNFNTHRVDVIKYSIERNLSVAISNYNNYSGASTNFQMPQLKDTDWDKIIDNISIISFLQGMNVGGKIYNGYSIITNNKNNDVVSEDSIYIKTSDGVAHRITEVDLENNLNGASGIFNMDIERRTGSDSNGNTIYYYPKEVTLSYNSIVTQNKVNSQMSNNDMLKKIYYTALGRERYSMYREKLEINQ